MLYNDIDAAGLIILIKWIMKCLISGFPILFEFSGECFIKDYSYY